MAGETRLVYEFEKNSLETVRVSLKTYRGTHVIDVRVFFPVGGGDHKPTRKGLTISTTLLPQLARAVVALQEAIEQELDSFQSPRQRV